MCSWENGQVGAAADKSAEQERSRVESRDTTDTLGERAASARRNGAKQVRPLRTFVDAIEFDGGNSLELNHHRLRGDEKETLVERIELTLNGLHGATDALELVVLLCIEASRLDRRYPLSREGRDNLAYHLGHVTIFHLIKLPFEATLDFMLLHVEGHLWPMSTSMDATLLRGSVKLSVHGPLVAYGSSRINVTSTRRSASE